MKQRFDLVGKLDGIKRTPQGGIRATANLTRVGVFTYHGPDNTTSRELRHPDEIFKADALETLKLAPLTIGHPGMVGPENFQRHSVGVVAEDVRADGKFVRATILVQDADAVRRVELGQKNPKHADALVELSCGYECEVEKADGEFEGEPFNAKQTGHKYNHVALGPSNWGRAGSEVRIHLDEAGNAIVDSYTPDMSLKTDDNKDAQARIDALTGERDGLKADLATTKAALDAANAENTRIKADSAKLIDPAKVAEMVASRVALESSARRVLGDKFDAKDEKGAPLTDRAIMTSAIVKAKPSTALDGKSDDYVRAIFDQTVEACTKADTATVELGKASTPAADPANVAPPKSKLDEAEERQRERDKKAAQAGAPEGSLTRKA